MKRLFGFIAFLAAVTSPAIADDIGHGKPNSGTDAMPVEESETTESSTDTFFDELLDVFTIESDGE